MADDRHQDTHPRPATTRPRVLAAGAVAPVRAGAPTPAACALPHQRTSDLVRPKTTKLADRPAVTKALGRPGDMRRYVHHTGLPRRDLNVVSRGVRIDSAPALGPHVSLVRYEDGGRLPTGDVVLTERARVRGAAVRATDAVPMAGAGVAG